jgi:hypothetical protein
MIYSAPTSYQPIRPGLAGSKQAVASGGGKAFASHRNFLQLRQVLTESRGYEGATAPLLVEVSADGKTWKRVWDSSRQAIPEIYPAPTERAAKVALPSGKLNLRFVTVAKAGQVTPRLDDVRVMLPMPSVR